METFGAPEQKARLGRTSDDELLVTQDLSWYMSGDEASQVFSNDDRDGGLDAGTLTLRWITWKARQDRLH